VWGGGVGEEGGGGKVMVRERGGGGVGGGGGGERGGEDVYSGSVEGVCNASEVRTFVDRGGAESLDLFR